MQTVLDLTRELIAENSITPNDGNCQKIIAARLEKSGFTVTHMPFANVKNLWARLGSAEPCLVFAGHTDVVPPGPLDQWRFDPFTPSLHDNFLYGRGAADMKSGLAAMIIAAENFLKKNPIFTGSIAFLITSDEEGLSINGTKKVIETLLERNERFDYCIIGEASSEKILGDQIRVGRRGSLHGNLIIHGMQGHIAYPETAVNPIHALAPILNALTTEVWDEGNEYFPPTSFQISNIHSGTGAGNIIPANLEMKFNFRFSSAITVDEIESRVKQILMKYPVKYSLDWNLSGMPFLTPKGKFVDISCEAIKEVTNLEDINLSTGGGTSDGRFIADIGAEIIELGPIHSTVHKVNECINLDDLNVLPLIYERILHKIFF